MKFKVIFGLLGANAIRVRQDEVMTTDEITPSEAKVHSNSVADALNQASIDV